jgi:hypothetical protein
MAGETEFTGEPPPEDGKTSEISSKEERFFDETHRPNSFKFNFLVIKGSYDPENSIAIFAIVGLVLLCLTLTAIAVAAIWHPAVSTWTEKAITIIGGAMSALIGAIVGSSANGRKRRS